MIRDFKNYFVTVQKQYNDLLKILEKVNKELEEGLCTNEQRDNFVKYYEAVKTNYDRLSYVKYLLELPPKFIQNIQKKRLIKKYEKQMEEYIKNKADADSVKAENEENIENMRSLSAEVLLDSEGEF